jgi:hypothetical protein
MVDRHDLQYAMHFHHQGDCRVTMSLSEAPPKIQTTPDVTVLASENEVVKRYTR